MNQIPGQMLKKNCAFHCERESNETSTSDDGILDHSCNISCEVAFV